MNTPLAVVHGGRELVDDLSAAEALELLGPSDADTKGRRSRREDVEIRTLADILADPAALRAPEPVISRFAWRGRVTLFAAREKDGKSTTIAAGCAAVTTGGAFLGEYPAEGDVLWYSADNEALYDVAARFGRFDVAPRRVYLVTRRPATIAALYPTVHELRPAVFVVDTLASAVLDRVTDAAGSSEWPAIMLELVDLARETGAAVVLLHHASKVSGRYRDSTAIGAGVDAILEMEPATDDPAVRRIRARARWAMEPFAVRLTDAGLQLEHAAPSLDAEVLAYVEGHPGASTRTIREGIDARDADVAASLDRLRRQSLVEDRGQARRHSWYRAAVPAVRTTPEPLGPAVVPVPLKGAAPAPQHHRECPTCHGTTWWTDASGNLVCATCHPDPHSGAA